MEPQLEGCGKRTAMPYPTSRVSASMEPQLEGCGKERVERMQRENLLGFNGAAT